MSTAHNRSMTLKEARVVLDIDEKTHIDQIKQSYRRAARLYHPDVKTGLSDPERFYLVVTAYNLIIQDMKKRELRNDNGVNFGAEGFATRPEDRKKGVFSKAGSFFKGFSSKREAKEAKWESAKKKNGSDSFYKRRSAGLISLKELISRFDQSTDTWVQIESAHTIFDSYKGRFEMFAVPRLKRSKETVQAELIGLLGKLGSFSALRSIAPYLTSRNREVLAATFLALDGAGSRGDKILDHYLNPSSAFMYQLKTIFRKSDFEKRIFKDRIIPPEKLRRLSAIMRNTGVPLKDLLEEIGVTLPHSA